MPKGTVESCGTGQHEKMRLPGQSALASWTTGRMLVVPPARHYDSPRRDGEDPLRGPMVGGNATNVSKIRQKKTKHGDVSFSSEGILLESRQRVSEALPKLTVKRTRPLSSSRRRVSAESLDVVAIRMP
ncbi:hypothetical protein EYF80_029943 [Liparis tanakae]|uniref:Uncharacterized protein n=1 Tax=Liparis tanakae TaxID=230148 RepID=A0A4Z2H1S2_9TELE|nr:hypothetical protein EYF80_029943 [Liparis tanakae]